MSNAFKKLEQFILKEMRMSHIYQPVMISELLNNGGRASTNQIAKALLIHDDSQIEYYEHVTKNMVGKVLTKNRNITKKDGDYYYLNGFESLSNEEITTLISLCYKKTSTFISERGETIWEHRRKSAGYIPGTARYEVLKRAKFRCELCGIAADEKALEVDHILPRNHGGSDEINNLQALCYSCNASKGDRDNTDFRQMNSKYENRDKGCLFCESKKSKILGENDLAYAIQDAFPVTQYHTLIIPKRHVVDFFDLFQPERNAIHQLLEQQRSLILQKDPIVSAFNIGVNAGTDAGQTINHCHFHLIPRRNGDMANPRGGVRGVIPEKQKY